MPYKQDVGGSNPSTPTISAYKSGRLAQLGERLPYKQDVGGSNPSTPTIILAVACSGFFLLPESLLPDYLTLINSGGNL